MLHIYICKTELKGKLPAETVYFDQPEEVTHIYKGEEYKIPLKDLTPEGWKALLHKGKRYIADGSKSHKQAANKIERLQGKGKPPKPKGTRNHLAAYFAEYVAAKIRKGGVKAKDVPKLGNNVEEITTSAKKHGVSDEYLKKALARAKERADLATAPIE